MKKDGRQLSKDAQREIRLRAIEYWKKNVNMKEAARVFEVSYSCMRKWVDSYKSKGQKSLLKDERGRPKGKELTPEQEKAIIKKISTKQPDQLKLSFGLWTRENVAELIEREYGIKRSVWQIGRYLRDWGFTPQKPIYKAYEQQSKAVKNWLDEIYPQLEKKSRKEKAMIFWGDETGIRSHDSRGRTFAPVGKTPTVRKTARRFGVTMISAVNNRGKLYFMILPSGINSDLFIKFLQKLIESRKEKIFLIIDNLPVHKTKRVKEWVWNHRARMRIFFLPPYSPELNPDEYLNQDLKANIVGKVKMNDSADLVVGIKSFMQKRQKNPTQVKKYFHHPKVKYAA